MYIDMHKKRPQFSTPKFWNQHVFVFLIVNQAQLILIFILKTDKTKENNPYISDR